jgi:hypothetical protein
MATVQVNNSSLTGNGYGSYLEVNNANGTIKANGSVISGVADSVATPTPSVGVFGSVVVEDVTTLQDYASKAVSAGEFAYNNVKPISSLITSELAGVSNDAIKTTGNDGDTIRSINKLEVVRTRKFTSAIRENKYNRVTNTFDAGYPQVQVDTFATDEAATPTGSVPGELTYMSGNTTPYNDNYKAKTNY